MGDYDETEAVDSPAPADEGTDANPPAGEVLTADDASAIAEDAAARAIESGAARIDDSASELAERSAAAAVQALRESEAEGETGGAEETEEAEVTEPAAVVLAPEQWDSVAVYSRFCCTCAFLTLLMVACLVGVGLYREFAGGWRR